MFPERVAQPIPKGQQHLFNVPAKTTLYIKYPDASFGTNIQNEYQQHNNHNIHRHP